MSYGGHKLSDRCDKQLTDLEKLSERGRICKAFSLFWDGVFQTFQSTTIFFQVLYVWRKCFENVFSHIIFWEYQNNHLTVISIALS